jgi:hypothetical protein
MGIIPDWQLKPTRDRPWKREIVGSLSTFSSGSMTPLSLYHCFLFLGSKNISSLLILK